MSSPSIGQRHRYSSLKSVNVIRRFAPTIASSRLCFTSSFAITLGLTASYTKRFLLLALITLHRQPDWIRTNTLALSSQCWPITPPAISSLLSPVLLTTFAFSKSKLNILRLHGFCPRASPIVLYWASFGW